MKLKIGDAVEFKKYEDLSTEETAFVAEEDFPKYGKVSAIKEDVGNNSYLSIEGNRYYFNTKAVARVVSEDVLTNSLKPGDEILVKVTVKKVSNGFLQVKSSIGEIDIDYSDVVKLLKHSEPEPTKPFIVKDDFYGKYVGEAKKLVSDKSKAKVFKLQSTAKACARDMNLYVWKVIPYEA